MKEQELSTIESELNKLWRERAVANNKIVEILDKLQKQGCTVDWADEIEKTLKIVKIKGVKNEQN